MPLTQPSAPCPVADDQRSRSTEAPASASSTKLTQTRTKTDDAQTVPAPQEKYSQDTTANLCRPIAAP